ncbi:Polysaccharide biosynthesis protein [[Ruminococcus] torques]|uniref:Polysaccharide biosynthesis protein n=1 Tax=[Ruminococcus] torques TaxID=33039 RepID=A0A564SNQ7_9FIRM|nr:oligosaccharide flippase family protein [[Ruminococcus] torques]VUW96824.1 Polysaccharide biosynthesis protein [[Ruminococcus] torques]
MNFIKKYKSISVQARAAIWFSACSILQKGISFIVVPFFTRILTTEQYGTYSLYLSWLQILTIITSLYLYYGVFTNGMNKYDTDRDRYISSMQGLTLTITAIVFIIFFATQNAWSDILGLAPHLIFLMFVEMAVTPALSFWSGRQRFEYKYRKLVIVTLCKSIVNPVLGLIMVSLAEDKATARILSVVIVEVCFCGVIMIYQFLKGKCWIDKKYWKFALGMAIPLLPHYLSGMILNKGDQIMISKMVSTSAVAFYSVAYNIGMLVQIFTNAISNSFTPWIYQRIKADKYEKIPETINFLMLLVAAISLCLMLLSPELVLLFGSSGYASAAYVIPPVAASVFFIFLYNILATPQFYFEKTSFLMVSSILAAVVNLGLNYIFIKQYGYVAAGYTTLVCYVLYSIGHAIISRKVMKEFIPGKILFDYKCVVGLSVFVIFAGIGCNFLFDYKIVRYGLLVIFGVVAFAKRDLLMSNIIGLKKK